jgi:predicted Fe-S protein YdhL (DUF1289 family)
VRSSEGDFINGKDFMKCKQICKKTTNAKGVEYCLGCGRTMEEIVGQGRKAEELKNGSKL